MEDAPRPRLAERIPRSARVSVGDATVDRVWALLDEGRPLDAHAVAVAAGPLQAWSGGRALVAASRVAGHLGAPRLSTLLVRRARREHPHVGTVRAYWADHLLEAHGPMRAWDEALDAAGDGRVTLTDADRSDLLVVRALVAATYRERETSAALLAQARALRPDHPWPRTAAAYAAALEDRFEDALALALEALAMRPAYRPAVGQAAQLLDRSGRRDEAVALLEDAARRTQSPSMPARAYELLSQTGDPDHILALLDLVEERSPIADPLAQRWLAAARCHAHGRRRDFAAAAREAARVGGTWHRRYAERLAVPDPAWRRVRLPVPFVAQAYRTCGPATLAALSAYAGRPVPQAAIVAAIWDGGTEDHDERRWCETNGFAAREFRVTWEAARALVDAGIPFATVTKGADSGHIQPLVGYDDARRSFLLSEPSGAEVVEVDADELLASQRAVGPRGLAFVAAGDRARLDALPLPDAALYDRAYEALTALARFDRPTAVAAAEAVEAEAPGHVLATHVRLRIAAFDQDDAEALRLVDAALARTPGDAYWVAAKARCLRTAGRRADRVALLEAAVAAGAEPALHRDLAVELLADARTGPRARRLLRAAHAAAPRDAWTLSALATVAERAGAHARAFDLRRFAASLDDTDEALAQNFAVAAASVGRLDEALDTLRRRAVPSGARSSAPVTTLAEVLFRRERSAEALDVLTTAAAARPDDGALLLALADLEARVGRLDEARAHLAQARTRSRPGPFLRAEAALCRRAGDLAASLAAWRRVLEREPLALDAHREVAWHRAALEGPAAAVAHLEGARARFPHHLGLASALLERVRDADPARAEALVREVIALEPSDAWWHRELAMLLQRRGRPDEALVAARAALDIAPHAGASHAIVADLHLQAGRADVAHEGFRQAVRADVDYGFAVSRLLSCATEDAARREDLAFLAAELRRQPTDGTGFRAYARVARAVLEPAVLGRALEELAAARPDVPAAASVLVRHRLATDDVAGATSVAEAAVGRFPAAAEAWHDLATARRRAGDVEGAAAVARRAVELAPEVAAGWLELARHHRDAGAPSAAVVVLRDALRHDPSSPVLGTELADVLWRVGDPDAAWRAASRVVLDDPGYDDAWSVLREVSDAGAPGRDREALVALARRATTDRPGDPDAWMALAHALPPAAQDERIAAFERAASLDPWRADAYDQRARTLALQGRFDEARAALAAGPWPETARPVPILGREAWLQAEEGRRPDAIAAMTRVLARAGDYAWGWAMLAEWAEAEKDLDAWGRAAEALVRLQPTEPLPCAQAADVALARGDRPRAVEQLRAALARDPGYGYGAWRLLSLAWEARSRAELDDLTARVRPEGTTGMLADAARALRAGLDGAVDAARRAAEAALAAPETATAAVDLLGRAFRDDLGPTWARRFDGWLDRLVRDEAAGVAALRHWLARSAPRRWPSTTQVVGWVRRFGADADPLLADLLGAAGTAKRAARVVVPLIAAVGDRLRGHPDLWGKTGYALCESGLDAEAARWLEDGPTRPDAEGWMLWNRVLALGRLGRDRDAEATSLAVVRRGLRDATWAGHVGFAAYGEARAGRLDAARAILEAAPADGGDGRPTSATLARVLAAALVDVGSASTPAEAAARLATRRREARAVASSLPATAPDDARRWDEATRALARAAGRRRPFSDRRIPGRGSRSSGWIWGALVALYVLIKVAQLLGRGPPR